MTNNLRKAKQDLCAYIKRCKNIHYSESLLIAFLIAGITGNLFPESKNTNLDIENQKQLISTSIKDIHTRLKGTRKKNDKLLKNTNLELIQLMEQGDYVIKSPWSSWQYGMNYFYNNWNGTYKGRGDKKAKYPYEGVYSRSHNLFLRNISPDSELYEEYVASIDEPFANSATTSTIRKRGGSTNYGLASTIANQEPIASIELGVSVRPKNIFKSPVAVIPPAITVNTVTPLNTPTPPGAPASPTINIPEFNPVAPDPITVSLPIPPTFNIKLGSFCNPMTRYCGDRPNGGGLGGIYGGTPRSYDHGRHAGKVLTDSDISNRTYAVRYSWSSFNGALLKVYFDFGAAGGTIARRPGSGTLTLGQNLNLTIDSVREGTIIPANVPSVNGAYNTGMFLTGGSRVATLDDATNATIDNKGKINMMGPLVAGFEVQSDKVGSLERKLVNSGVISDEIEKSNQIIDTSDTRLNKLLKIKQLKADGSGLYGTGINPDTILGQDSTTLTLPPFTHQGSLDISRDPDIINSDGTLKRAGGYTGYKIGLILTYENTSNKMNNDGVGNNYVLTNQGTINFQGKKSIGIQVYAPGKDSANGVNKPLVNVENKSGASIIMGGVASYGLKLSSRVDEDSKVENAGKIYITGDNTVAYKQDNNASTPKTYLYDSDGSSLSSGIAIIEDSSLSGASSIRAHQGMVSNKGEIYVSGGQGNTGMVLILKANDDITNESNINISDIKNIGMRVDLGSVTTDDPSSRLLPTAINKGTIAITDGEQNIGMVANDSSANTTLVNGETVMKHRAVAKNESGNILFNNVSKKAIGMFAQNGGEIINNGTIKGNGTTSLEDTVGMVIQPANGTKKSNGTNTGTIDLEGKKVTGVYNQGIFKMENANSSVTTAGDGAISLYARGNTSETKINSGKIIAKKGALGLFANENATVNLGTSSDAPELEAHGAGTLLFYNYTKDTFGNYTANGIFKLNNNNVKATLDTGATAFYFKNTSAANSTVTGSTAQKLNAMFAGSGSNKLKLKLMDKNSTLFVLDNENPNATATPLTSVDSSITQFLGSFVEIDSSSSNNYKIYKTTKASLSIDTDVNLDNHTSSAIDRYYRVDFLNSAVTVEAGKKMVGTDVTQIKQVIAQSNYADATNDNHVKVINNGTIDFSKKGGTAIAVDYAPVINNGIIKMDAANSSTENSTGIFGASGSRLTNSSTGEIRLGINGVGIWGTNKISTSVNTWSKNIDITNNGKITGISGKEGIFGIYADNDTTSYSGATSNITQGTTGNIDFSQAKKTVGIYMKNGVLTSSGDISVNEGSVGIDATNSDAILNGGTHTIGKESVGFKLTGSTSKLMANSGNISITGIGSAAYLFDNVSLTSGTNFNDNLTLTSTKAYTYLTLINNSHLNYMNTKTIANDESIFVNAKDSTVSLLSGTNVTSTNKKVTGVYSENSAVSNDGILTLTGAESSALYGKAGSFLINTGKITIGKSGSGIYSINSTGKNNGEITIGQGSVGMRAEDAIIENGATGKILGIGAKATGMSQSGGTQDITNNGTITLTGDKSTALHSEGITSVNHKVINTGNITVGDSSNELTPSVGIYSANGTNSTVENFGKVVAGIKSTAIYAGNVDLKGSSETTAGNGGIAVYSKEGTVNISANSKVNVGATLGNGQEGAGVYLAGNNQTLNSDTDKLTIGQGSFGYVMTGQGNTVRTGVSGTTGVVTLSKDSVFMYSRDKAGTIKNYNNLKSTGNENYGIYALGSVENYGNIDFNQGIGNVGAYSYVEGATTTPNAIKNYGTISVSKSDINDPNNRKYGIGMAAGFGEEVPAGSGNYVVKGLGNIENHGIIKVTDPDSIGMYATGKGSRIYNSGRIELSGPKRNIGIFAENGAEVINTGTITTVGSGNVGQIGIALRKGAILDNRGTIHIDASKGYGLFLAGAIIKNYGTANITVENGATPIKEITAADTSKDMQDLQDGMNRIRIHSPAGATEAKIIANGRVQIPTVVHVQAIPNRKPNDIPTSSVGMYVDTSGINYTRPITNIGALRGLTQSDLIIGNEATKYTTSKYIQLGQDIIEPYNDMIRTSGIEKWNIYAGSLSWMASITQLPDYTIRNAYLAKVPYTVWAGRMSTPINRKDTYNFTNGLEQLYGVEVIGTKENQVFQKLNSIGNNEEVLLYQAFDEMMGHQYGNTQQRINETASLLDKEFTYLRHDWRNPSKQNNKIKVFGMRNEYNSDTAGIIDYRSNAYGVAYVHEDEKIKMGNSSGWYAGAVTNRFKFKDIGKSRENQTILKAGIFKTMSPKKDHNGALQWTIGADAFVGINDMRRRYLVVDEVFEGKSNYNSYGAALKTDLGYDIRMSERTHLRPYGSLKMEYGRFNSIREKNGQVRLEVQGNDYFSVKPEVGAEFRYVQPLAVRTNLTVGLKAAYENELGKVGNVNNKGRVRYTNADWFGIRGEKDDRRGNGKFDLNIGVDNTRFGVTVNAGYDTKGKNVRGGIGFRAIY